MHFQNAVGAATLSVIYSSALGMLGHLPRSLNTPLSAPSEPPKFVGRKDLGANCSAAVTRRTLLRNPQSQSEGTSAVLNPNICMCVSVCREVRMKSPPAVQQAAASLGALHPPHPASPTTTRSAAF